MSYFENLNPTQMLHAIGLQRETESAYFADTVLPALGVFAAGVLVGAAVAVLVTPKTGRELRNDLSRKASELTDSVRSQIPALRTASEEPTYADRYAPNANPDL